jgi:hypothetical protein
MSPSTNALPPVLLTEAPSPAPMTTTTAITSSPIVTDLLTSPPTSFSPVLNSSTPSPSDSTDSESQEEEIDYKKKVPVISLNCGGPTLNLTTPRKAINSNNETSMKNTSVVWESDEYYNTEYRFGSSRIRSKINTASCQDYLIPDNANSDAATMMESISVFDDRDLDSLFCTERFFVSGFGGYEIPVYSEGRYYRIEIHMMESFHTDIYERVFDIVIENEIRNANFDIYAAAGGRHKKVSVVHVVYVSDSSISIYLNGTINFPLINAISISYLILE